MVGYTKVIDVDELGMHRQMYISNRMGGPSVNKHIDKVKMDCYQLLDK